MTYPLLLTVIYANFTALRAEWARKIAEHDSIGAFVFEPEGYSNVESFDRVRYEFWSITEMRAHLIQGRETDEGLINLIQDLDVKEEFVVMIIEHLEGSTKRAVHVHRITRLGMN